MATQKLKPEAETKIVVQHNSITNARYDYDACQMDILFSALADITPQDDAMKKYVVSIAEIEKTTGRKWNYSQFKIATGSMGSRMFELQSGTDRYRQFWLFSSVDYITGSGRIEIQFNPQALEFLKDLKGNFTTFMLQAALQMKSKYAKRIYQICSQWKDIGTTPNFEINDFKYMLKLIDKDGTEEYKDISMFKKRVLDTAIKEINERSELKVEYKLKGELGKKKPIKFILFTIVKKKRNAISTMPIPFEGVMIPEAGNIRKTKLIDVLTEIGVVRADLVNKILESEELTAKVFEFNYRIQTGKITAKTNKAGLLLKTLGLV